MQSNDNVNHPSHYTSHASGVEAIELTAGMEFCLGNAVKYLFRAGKKEDELEDWKKARWYIAHALSEEERKWEEFNTGPMARYLKFDANEGDYYRGTVISRLWYAHMPKDNRRMLKEALEYIDRAIKFTEDTKQKAP